MELLTFTIITTAAANDVMKDIHDRMPVILSRDEAEQWLNTDATPDNVAAFLRPCPKDWLALRKVGTLINSPRNDRPECVAPMD